MTTYYCKCGRKIRKSTKATTTGNRDTAGCKGCPYLLPYGPNEWDKEQKSFVQTVVGYECRMTDHPVDYTTHISSYGGPNEKTALHIQSLDFGFLQTVTDWVRENFPGGELTGGFDREHMRAVEFFDGYRLGFYPAQNKKGVAAKQQLFRRFFHPDGTRLDMTPEEEKAKVLADIEKGKDAAQNKECQMKDKVYKDAKGILYRVGETGELGNADRCRLTIQQLGITPGALWRKKSMAPNWSMAARKDALQALDIMAEENDWKEATEAEVQYNLTERTALLDDDPDGTSLYSLDLSEQTIRYLEESCVDTAEELDGLLECEKDKIREISTADMDKINAYLRKNSQNPADDLPWSAAATAAESQSAESPEAAASEPTTETAVTVREKAGDVSAPVPASADLPAAFDYSGLDEQTVVDLHLAEREYTAGKKLTEMGLRRMADGVAIAHEALCVSNTTNCRTRENGRFALETQSFGSWCDSVGLNRKAAERLLQVSRLFDASSPTEQKVLEDLSPSLLYAAAKPSAPVELVQAVKDGDITTHKEYQAAMARIKQLEKDAELDHKERDAAYAKADQYRAEADRRAQDQQRLEGLVKQNHLRIDEVHDQMAAETEARIRAEHALKDAQEKAEFWENKWNTDMPEMQRLIDEADDETEAAKKALAEISSAAPIEASTVDLEEIERRAQELAQKKLSEQASPLEVTVDALRQMIDAAWGRSHLDAADIATQRERDSFDALSDMLVSIVNDIDDMVAEYDHGQNEGGNEGEY